MGTKDPAKVLANNSRALPTTAATATTNITNTTSIANANTDKLAVAGGSNSCSKSENRKINDEAEAVDQTVNDNDNEDENETENGNGNGYVVVNGNGNGNGNVSVSENEKLPVEVCQSNCSESQSSPPLSAVQPTPNGKQSLSLTTAGKKIRRAFSMPRNPFRWSRKFKTNNNNNNSSANTSGGRNSVGSCGVSGGSGGVSNSNDGDNGVNDIDNKSMLLRHHDLATGNHKEKSKTLNCMSTADGGEPVGGSSIDGDGDGGGTQSQSGDSDQNKSGRKNTQQPQQHRVFRRSSFRKFLNRIAQHVSSVSSIGHFENTKHFGIMPLYTGCWRRNEANKHASTSSSLADRVPPIGGYQWPADQTPGVTGLKNHGNTCFMNAVLQCLSHTDILAEYFVLDQYKVDLKKRNKINSRKFGTKGELTEQLANVLKALWTCKNESDHSTSFKAVVDRYGSQFRSSTQHDAQEFLFWLLDKVHEDLNTATKRRYKSVKNNYGRSDEVIAAETLANHIRCNNSFVQAVFQAQFRSSLTCPRCKKQSNTFDPFHCISVQLPQLTQQAVFVTVLYMKQHPRQVKLGLTVPAGSPIVVLRDQLQKDTGVPSNRMVLVEINSHGFSRVFFDTQPVSTLEGLDTVYCIEIPHVSSDSTDLMLLIANVRKTKDGSLERFGAPFCLQVARDSSYMELQKKLLKEISSIMKPEVFAYSTPLSDMFQVRLQDPSADPDTYLEKVEHPLFTEMIDLALSVLSSDAGPAHIKLLLEWNNPEEFFAEMTDPIVEHESVSRLRDNKVTDTALSLEQCLEHYTKAETLSAEDAWRCPHCQQYLPVVKTLGLWSLPDILVIHFKRFRQHHEKGPDAAKLTTMVKFPLNAFDMSPHLARGIGSNSIDSLNSDVNATVLHSTLHRSPWKKTREHRNRLEKENKDTRYDLYAVCYHQGDTLETGHYTAACKNPYDHQWYKFDDQRVSRVPSDSIQEEIINNEAYMLFYQRRSSDNVECSGSSSTSGDHWVSKIAIPSTTVSATATVAPKIEEKPEECSSPEKKQKEDENTEDIAKVNNVPIPEPPKTTTNTVIIEKTDENEMVDIEGIEFVDENPPESLPKVKTEKLTNGWVDHEHMNGHADVLEIQEAAKEASPKLKNTKPTATAIPIASTSAEISPVSPKKVVLPTTPIITPRKPTASSPIDVKTTSHAMSPLSMASSSSSSSQSHKFNGISNTNFKEALSSSLKSNSSSIMVSLGHDYNRGINGSGSSICLNGGNNHCVNLRHSFSNSSNYKLKECSDTLSTMLRNSANTCSKDTLIYIDQQSHSLIEDDDSFLSSPSLWISPVTPHKLITVSPKN